jgi:uncharacterized damage-inducible protein DinB
MKELLASYAAFNYWANEQLVTIAVKLNEEQQQQIIASSFPSVYKTCLHIWDAETIWWQRMKLQEQIIVPSLSGNNYSMQEIANGISDQDKLWMDWVSNCNEVQLQHVFAYYTMKKDYFKQPLWQAIHHLFNHSTYHRGQLVTMFRQLGIEKIPATDFVHWARKK